jgi:hypothetical protein
VVITGAHCPSVQDPGEVLPAATAAEFTRYLPFVQRCPVGQPSAPAVLFVVSVQVNDYYTSRPGFPLTEAIPKPVLITDHTVVGRLPVAFPDSGPVSATLRFGSWRDKWPGMLRITFESDAAGPPRPITMMFNHARRQFERTDPTP